MLIFFSSLGLIFPFYIVTRLPLSLPFQKVDMSFLFLFSSSGLFLRCLFFPVSPHFITPKSHSQQARDSSPHFRPLTGAVCSPLS